MVEVSVLKKNPKVARLGFLLVQQKVAMFAQCESSSGRSAGPLVRNMLRVCR